MIGLNDRDKFGIFYRRATGCALAVATLATAVAWAADPIDIGSRRELFVDDLLIEKIEGAELKLHAPVKAERAESPLPERHMMTVIKDGDLYRAWYRDGNPDYTGETYTGDAGDTVEYAESQDGREWEFPSLGLIEIGGSKNNNVVLANLPPFLSDFMIFLDTREGVDPAERYKAVGGYPGKGDKRGLEKEGIGLFGFVSPDGMRWTQQSEIIPYRPEWRHAMDSPNVAFWSEEEQLYVCYFRTWIEPDRLRSVSRATSPDFVNWSEPVALDPNLPGEHLYSNFTQPYERAPHLYLSFPTRFVPFEEDSAETVMPNRTDILFMTTRAGSEVYNRTFKEAFIRPGLEPHQWTNRANFVAQNVIQTAPDELSIYHRSGDRYVLRLDGFSSAHAGSEGGSLLTKPLRFAGNELELNLSTSAAGSVRVEILDGQGKVLAKSLPMIGDFIEESVTWEEDFDLATLADKSVQIRFSLKDADIYSFRFLGEPASDGVAEN